MRHDLLLLALTAALAGCTAGGTDTDTGNDTEDTGDTADTSDTSDTDTGVDTDTGIDTDTAVVPFCGDGNVDEGEQCDDADANGSVGDCSTECSWNGWVTCDLLAGPFATLDTSLPQPDGSFHVNGRFDGLVALDSSCVSDVVGSVAVTFTLPTAGSYKVSTDNSTDTANTAISLRTECDDRAEISCAVDNAPTVGSAQTFIVDGEAGSSWVALVEQVDASGDGWHLSLTPIDGVANAGDACDHANPCGDGSICTDAGILSVCVPDTTPTVTSATIEQIAIYDYKISLTGTDANHDVTRVMVPGFEDDYGDIWGDEDGEEPIVTATPTVTWSGDTFTASWVQTISFFDTGLGNIVNLDAQVLDRAGQLSNTVNVVFPAAVTSATMPYIGDDCDIAGFPHSCNPNAHPDPANTSVQIVGLTCTWNATNTETTCQDKNINPPPVMDGGEMYWQGPTAWLSLSGYDTVERISPGSSAGFTAITKVVYTDATTVNLADKFLSVCTFDHGDFTCDGSLVITPITKPVDHLEVLVKDNGFPTATTTTPIIIPWVDRVLPVESGYAEECDLRGWEYTCAEPYVCSPTLSGIPACLETEAPVLYEATGVYTGGFSPAMEITFEGSDVNADWYALMTERTVGIAYPMSATHPDTKWNPDPFGKQAYEGTTRAGFATWLYKVFLQDADGNVSDSEIVMGVPTQLEGASCSTFGTCNFQGCTPPAAYCDIEGGDTCSNRIELAGTVKVCEDAVAPALSAVTVERIDSRKYKVLWTGTDANGDAVDLKIVKIENGVRQLMENTPVATATPMFGNTAFSSSFTSNANSSAVSPNTGIINPDADIQLEVTIQDWAYLESNTVIVNVPPILHPGEECTGDATVGTCWEASECLSGECFAYEPQVASATLTYKNNGREGEVTIVGYDDKTGANHTLSKAYVTIAGFTTEVAIPKTGGTAPVWNGNQFTFKVTTLRSGSQTSGPTYQVGAGYLVDEQFVGVRVTDIGGFEDSGTFFLTPTVKGLDDACDVTGVSNICHSGLVCDAVALTCDNDPDPLKVCAGVPVLEATGDVTAYNFAASGVGLETYKDFASCGAVNNPNGKETVVRYTAAQTGTLHIVSASTDANKHPGYLFVRVNECVNYEAIVDCSNATPNGSNIPNNSVDVPVLAGDVVYVTVDGASFQKGAGTVTFSYLAE